MLSHHQSESSGHATNLDQANKSKSEANEILYYLDFKLQFQKLP